MSKVKNHDAPENQRHHPDTSDTNMSTAQFFPFVLHSDIDLPAAWRTGKSRQGRPLPAFRFGTGCVRLSLIAGCHADEPTGPRLLRKLVTFMARLDSQHPLMTGFTWFIVPHVNPDGEALNRRWYTEADEVYDLPAYLRHRVRELPGDDLEYGFPMEGKSPALRPENQFVYDCWKEIGGPFHLHASLHGMAYSFGAWFLIEQAWQYRSARIQQRCRECTHEQGYRLFDIDRKGEKGFFRIAEGFCTRPDSEGMKQHFLERNDPATAARFYPSSMESIRSLGGDCLTLVTEMPLFVLPQEEKDLSWPNPAFDRWSSQMGLWAAELMTGRLTDDEVRKAALAMGIRPMPAADQMQLQWCFLSAGVEEVSL